MPVSISGEVALAALLVAVGVFVVVFFELVVFVGAARRVGLTLGGVALIGLALLIGLAQSGQEWIGMSLPAQVGQVGTAVVIVAVLLLAAGIAVMRPSNRIAVALLGAGLVFQIAWAVGRFFLPGVPVVGEVLEQARCERQPYCFPGPVAEGHVELRIETDDGPMVAVGELRCQVDDRPIAGSLLGLSGHLVRDNPREEIVIDASLSRDDDPSTPSDYVGYVYLEGPLGGFRFVSGYINTPIFTPTDPSAASPWRAGIVSFEGLHMERLQPNPERGGAQMWLHEPALDDAAGTLTWTCAGGPVRSGQGPSMGSKAISMVAPSGVPSLHSSSNDRGSPWQMNS